MGPAHGILTCPKILFFVGFHQLFTSVQRPGQSVCPTARLCEGRSGSVPSVCGVRVLGEPCGAGTGRVRALPAASFIGVPARVAGAQQVGASL